MQSTRPTRILSRLLTKGLALAVILATSASAWGQTTYEWIGPPTGFFTNPVNWSPSAIPGPIDDISLRQPNGQVNFSVNVAANDLLVNPGSSTTFRTTSGSGDVSLTVNGSILDGTLDLVALGNSRFTLRNLGVMILSDSSAPGVLRVNGGTSYIQSTGLLRIGDIGHGTLEVLGGGQVTTTGFSSLAANFGGQGTAVVDGAGSRWTNGSLLIGQSGAATLDVTNGALVEATAVQVGGSATSSGVVTLAGADATLSIGGGTGGLVVGGAIGAGGTDVVNIEAGGVLTAGAVNVRPTGRINLRGGTLSFREFSGPAQQLDFQSGTLNIQNDFDTNHSLFGGGILLPANKALNVAGNTTVPIGSLLSLTGGSFTTGNLTLLGGTILGTDVFDLANVVADRELFGAGTVSTRVFGDSASVITANGPLTLGLLASPDGFDFAGTLNVGGQSVLILDADVAELGVSTVLGAAGQLTTVNGARIGAGEILSGGGLIRGDFTNNGAVDGPSGAGQFLSFNDNVDGAGGYTGNIEFLQGFSPGNSPAAVSLENVAFDSTSELLIELGGLTPGSGYDQLLISGNLALSGTLMVELLGSFLPGPGDVFEILNVGGALTGQFAGLDEGAMVGNYGGTDLFITYAAGDGNNVGLFTAVPEPSGVLLLALGVLGLTASIRRNRV